MDEKRQKSPYWTQLGSPKLKQSAKQSAKQEPKTRNKFELKVWKKLMDEGSWSNLELKVHPPTTFTSKVRLSIVLPIWNKN